MKTAILFPRLDLTFKNFGGPIPEEEGELPEIRQHWRNFLIQLTDSLIHSGHEVHAIKKPMWEFTPDYVKTLVDDYDFIFIPHKMKDNFDIGPKSLYYMQTVFPHWFTIDPIGWGANMTCAPIDVRPYRKHYKTFAKFKDRVRENKSKFDQPPSKKMPFGGYILFTCQLPHDETIRYHSKVSVEDALSATLSYSGLMRQKLVVKGHPVNPGSMEPLKNLLKGRQYAHWVDDMSIHDVLSQANMIFTVNSGTGIEAMLHEKPIYTFGRSEYTNAVRVTTPQGLSRGNIGMMYANKDDMVRDYAAFYEAYNDVCFDYNEPDTFTTKIDRLLNGFRH
jgi:hypothetical protein